MHAEPAIAFSLWHARGALVASLHPYAPRHATQAAIGRVTAPSPVHHGYLGIAQAHRGGRSRRVFDIAIGDDSRPAIIRAADFARTHHERLLGTG
jgi:hypothetical protein